MTLALSRWLWAAQLRAQPARVLVAILSIAIGVALALAIHLVNGSALAEFDSALAVINGEAQARIEARAGSFDERLYPQVARSKAVAQASPVIEVSLPASVAPAEGDGVDERPRVRVIGIDPMRAAAVTPDLLPTVAPSGNGEGAATDLFADDAIFPSPRALELLGARVGDVLHVGTGFGAAALRIAGTAERVPGDVALAVMDIGTIQWRLGWLGRLTRIDLRLAPGTTLADLEKPGVLSLPGDVAVVPPQAARQRMSNLSRAYRVNLTVLALVALFTGGFIVHAAMTLAVARQQGELALLGVLGADRRFVLRQTLGFALLPGLVGSALGIVGGIAGARILLALVGGDLGGGYFAGSAPTLAVDALSLTGFAAAGLATAVLGGLAPAWRVTRRPPARALRSGAVEELLAPRRPVAVPLAMLAVGAALLASPPIAGLPLPSYLAIALWLIAGIALVPGAVALAGAALRSDRIAGAGPAAWLAAQRVAATPASSGAALGGIVASVALASSMAIMVTSFRTAVDAWLDVVLPADLYVRSDAPGSGTELDEATQQRIAATPGAARVEFQHVDQFVLNPERPPVALIARSIDAARPGQRLPITGRVLPAPRGTFPIWVSEAMVDLYGWRPGARVALPIAASPEVASTTPGDAARPEAAFTVPGPDSAMPGAASTIPGVASAMPGSASEKPGQPAQGRFFVSGVWRDYARQHGAVVLDLGAWRHLTGDQRVTEASVWLAAGADLEEVAAHLRASSDNSNPLRVRSAGALREMSLKIFDRSFAVTWALEAVAILVALFGVAAAWSAEALARAREFGMLRHLGVTPGAIVRQFAIEAAALVACAVAWGLALGAAIALVLVHRVNPQSFHWTMDVTWPVAALTGGAAVLVALAIVVAVLAARQVSHLAPVQAVKEDW